MTHTQDSQEPSPDTTVSASGTALRLEGRDALDLLHRISTQALLDLEPGQARPTLFCDFRGRLLHRVVVAAARDGAVWLLRDDAGPEALVAHVERHVFREDLRIVPAPHAVRLRFAPSGETPGTLVEEGGAPRRVVLAADVTLEVGGARGDLQATESQRIAQGWPRHGHEIRDAFTPYEVGLAADVHLSKGCYTGQEALLRLMTYDSVRRALARVRGSGPAPPAPAAVLHTGERVGELTSSASAGEGWIGLAVIRKEALGRPAEWSVAGTHPIDGPAAFSATRPLGLP